MHKSLILAGVVGSLALPGAAQATDSPTSSDRHNAAQECRFERGSSAATHEAFRVLYGTNKSKSNAFGKCVSGKSREETKEREDAKGAGSQACRTERGTTAQAKAAFEMKYGTGKHKKNAFGKCVSAAAKQAKDHADEQDHENAQDRKNAARQCAQERGTDKTAFASKYGSKAGKANAFGKCVSKTAKTL